MHARIGTIACFFLAATPLLYISTSSHVTAVGAQQPTDTDGDGMPDAWETLFRLAPLEPSDAGADPDNDGVSNLQEFQQGSHPRGVFRRSLAEGATGFFDTFVSVLNPGAQTAVVLLTFQDESGVRGRHTLSVAGASRGTVDVKTVAGVETAEFSTSVESDREVVVDRRMTWDRDGYGSHAETATRPRTTWYFAEGATHSGFNLFYLLHNPGSAAATVTIDYLRPAPLPPIAKSYAVPAGRRRTIWANQEGPELASAEISATIRSDTDIVAERAMYLDAGGRIFAAGHNSAGIAAPSTQWFFAEGATGDYFDTFILLSNPNDAAAIVELTYLLETGTTFSRTYAVGGRNRLTVSLDQEGPLLAGAAVSTTVTSANGVAIVAERAMWWPGPTSASWYEAHVAAGSPATSQRWGFADGEVGGASNADTYILILSVERHPIFCNPPGCRARVTLMFDDGSSVSRGYRLPADSGRMTVDVRSDFPSAIGRRFGVVVESLPYAITLSPEAGFLYADLVVERAIYSDSQGTKWAAGSAAAATSLIDNVISLFAGFLTRASAHPPLLTIRAGEAVSFLNAARFTSWEIRPGPHPTHDGCPELNDIGVLNPGEHHRSEVFAAPKRCEYHDEFRVGTAHAISGEIVVQP